MFSEVFFCLTGQGNPRVRGVHHLGVAFCVLLAVCEFQRETKQNGYVRFIRVCVFVGFSRDKEKRLLHWEEIMCCSLPKRVCTWHVFSLARFSIQWLFKVEAGSGDKKPTGSPERFLEACDQKAPSINVVELVWRQTVLGTRTTKGFPFPVPCLLPPPCIRRLCHGPFPVAIPGLSHLLGRKPEGPSEQHAPSQASARGSGQF